MDEKSIKVLYVNDGLGPGGAERRFVQLLTRLTTRNFTAKVVLLTDIVHYDEIYDLDAEVIILKRKIRFDPLIYFKLFRICREYRPDIIHTWGSLPAVYAGPIAKIMNIRMINAMIASAPRKLSLKLKLRALFTFPLSDVIQANSYAGMKAYNAAGRKGIVIHNGFDFNRLRDLKDKNVVRNELNIETRYIVGMVASFSSLKDYGSLIEAARILLNKRDDITFVCVGSGAELEKMRQLAGFSDKIIFPGTRNDVESIVNTFDVGILSTYGEGISNSIMEYMALGKPVVAAEGGGTAELVADGRTGFLVPQRSPDILAEKIDDLLNDDQLRINMGISGKERIENEFNVDRMTEEHMNLYRRLASY